MEAKKELKYIFSNVNDWLKFAEAKHAGLIILNSGFVVGILTIYEHSHSYTSKPFVLIGMICFGISIFTSLISQFPTMQNIFRDRKYSFTHNLYFYKSLASMNVISFVEELKKIDSGFTITKLDNDLINQILINSRITQSKFSIFRLSSYITVLGLGIIGLSSIIKILWHF